MVIIFAIVYVGFGVTLFVFYLKGVLKAALIIYKEGYVRHGVSENWFLLAYLSYIGVIMWRRYIKINPFWVYPSWTEDDEWKNEPRPCKFNNHKWALVIEEHVEAFDVVKDSALYGIDEYKCYWIGSNDKDCHPVDMYNPYPNRPLKRIAFEKKQVCGSQGWFYLWFEDNNWKISSMTMVPIFVQMESRRISELRLLEYRENLSLVPPAKVIISNQTLLLLSLERREDVL